MADKENLRRQRDRLREFTTEQLEAKLAELREERFKLRVPLGHRVDREPDAVPHPAPRHRPDPDDPGREAPQGIREMAMAEETTAAATATRARRAPAWW